MNKNRKNRKFIRPALALWAAFIAISASAFGQLELVDMVHPYKFTAGILENGHFYITTKYIGDTTKQLIYVGQKDPILPPNYTSHVHIKVDDHVFQMPFEDNPTTKMPPPENVLIIEELFRDTLEQLPRVCARMLAIDPATNDSLHFVFSLMPIKKAEGGFVRLAVEFGGSKLSHRLGVLMEIDTKIGNNDKAPIVTSLGHYTTEHEFTSSTNPRMPDFWLALEGTPANPQLTARGNLRADGLITPDYFLIGNWKDYSSGSIVGLNGFLWKDRAAQASLPYDDSAVLLVWDEKMIPGNTRQFLAKTEIGIVDSLKVVDAGNTHSSSGSSSGLGFGIFYSRASGCSAFDTILQKNCADPAYHVYSPDSLELVFVITNTNKNLYRGVHLQTGALPEGLRVQQSPKPVVPNDLAENTTAVGTLTFYADPRLNDANLSVPVYMLNSFNDTLAFDEICIFVPGVVAHDSLVDLDFELSCPSTADTMMVPLFLKGLRCRDIDTIFISGNLPDRNCFSLVKPIPKSIPADGFVPVYVRFQAQGLATYTANLTARIIDYDGFAGGDTIRPGYTSKLSGTGKDEEFLLANKSDTLNFHRVCIGDTTFWEWPIRNVGGCDVLIEDYMFIHNLHNSFSLRNDIEFPISIPKNDDGSIGRAIVRFAPKAAGWDTTFLIVSSLSAPIRDTLMIIGYGDLPAIITPNKLIDFDTICPNQEITLPAEVLNQTACIADVDSVWTNLSDFSASPTRFSILPESDFSINLQAKTSAEGTYSGKLYIKTKSAVDSTVQFRAVVATRLLETVAQENYGDVRYGKSKQSTFTVRSVGTAGVVLDAIEIRGLNPADYIITLPAGAAFPLYLAPTAELTFDVEFRPTDLEQRSANIYYRTATGKCCTEPVQTELRGRGYRPIVDLANNSYHLSTLCLGEGTTRNITIRNSGNGPLLITGYKTVTGSGFALANIFPVTIDSSATISLPVSFTPKEPGDFALSVFFESDGDFLVKDTLLHLAGRGDVCAVISVDSVSGELGQQVLIPVRIRPKSGVDITTREIFEAMNRSGKTDIEFTVGHNRRILRFAPNIVSGALASIGAATPFADSVMVATPASATLTVSDTLALLRAEALLGDDFRSYLALKVNSFASGYSQIQTENGDFLEFGCSLENRFMDAFGVVLNIIYNPTAEAVTIEFFKKCNSAQVKLYDSRGALVQSKRLNEIEKGQKSELPTDGLPQGIYFVNVSTDRLTASTKILIVR